MLSLATIKRAKELLQRTNLTATDIANLLKVSRSTVRRIKAGPPKKPKRLLGWCDECRTIVPLPCKTCIRRKTVTQRRLRSEKNPNVHNELMTNLSLEHDARRKEIRNSRLGKGRIP